jgi:cation transport ATPase
MDVPVNKRLRSIEMKKGLGDSIGVFSLFAITNDVYGTRFDNGNGAFKEEEERQQQEERQKEERKRQREREERKVLIGFGVVFIGALVVLTTIIAIKEGFVRQFFTSFFFIFVIVFHLCALIYLICKYIAYQKYDKKKTTEIKRTKVDFVLAIYFLVIGVISLPFTMTFTMTLTMNKEIRAAMSDYPLERVILYILLFFGLFVLVFPILFLLKRHKMYKIYGEEIERQQKERRQQKEERKKQSEERRQTSRIISRIAILLVVMGFFMPMCCDQTGFELAEHTMKLGKADNDTSLGMALYGLFISALLGAFLLIPLVMEKEVHIGFDWTLLVISFVCAIFAYVKLKESFQAYEEMGGQVLQIGGWFVIIGLIGSLITLFRSSV